VSGLTPETRFAWAGDLSIAYQTAGAGTPYLIMVPGLVSHVEALHDLPGYTGFLTGLAQFCCAVPFDKRGYGLSDRVPAVPTLEDRMSDIEAVSRAVGASRITVSGWSEGGPIAALYAATYPERVDGLVIWDSFHRFRRSAGTNNGVTDETLAWMKGPMVERWGSGVSLQMFRPEALSDPAQVELWARIERNTMTPSALSASWEWVSDVDIGAVLPTITVPTLLINRRDSFWAEQMREIAAVIPSAQHVEFPGIDHFPSGHGDDDDVIETIGTFITGERPADTGTDRFLTTVLFTDLVSSTERAAGIGDRRWKELLDAHDKLVARQAKRFRGTIVKATGDGALLAFDGPSRAVDCALAITEGVHALGLEARAGLHTGEVERRADGDLAGIAVHIAARVQAAAAPSQVLVSSTVRDLVVGSPHRLAPAGSHTLKGVPGDWQLFAVGH
jgi:class 3 adenylate cyclase/pimeloyl-ACP methyl ester carboxylesterase